jgi:hypothetical protein
VETALSTLGRALFFSGILPVLVWLGLNVLLLWRPDLTLSERVAILLQSGVSAEHIAFLLSVGLVGGSVLYSLNGFIIRCYEGTAPLLRGVLGGARRRNLARHATLYGQLLGARRVRDEALARAAAAGTSPTRGDLLRQADSAAAAVDDAFRRIEEQHQMLPLPLQDCLVKPTDFGNAYAVLEEYAYERYGMDTMVFWPRMLAVVPTGYQQAIGDQKSTCDFLLHTSLLLGVFALQALVLVVRAAFDASRFPAELLIALLLSAASAYFLYRAAVTETRVLGTLIAGAFDLHRRALLEQLGLSLPPSLDAERALWRRLAAFIRRGDRLYDPRALQAAAAGDGTGPPTGAGTAAT